MEVVRIVGIVQPKRPTAQTKGHGLVTESRFLNATDRKPRKATVESSPTGLLMVPQASTSLGADMLRALSTYVKDYQEAYQAGRRVLLPPLENIDHVVLTGMGGSGISASLAAALAKDTSPRPITVVKDYHLPAFVNKRSLVVAISYSGNTEETLVTVAEANDRRASIIGLSSGGALAAFCQKKKLPLYGLPKDRQPRAALPFLLGGLGGMLDALGLGGFALDPRDESSLQYRQVQLQPRLAGADDAALRYADQLRNARPVIVGDGHLFPVAVRWKCQLNENAKMFARAEPVPEANHNDLVAWAEAPKTKQDVIVLLRRPQEPREIEARYEFLADVARKAKVPVIQCRAEARTPLGQCLEHLLIGDYTSVYAAILRRVDPTPVEVIADLKARLEKDGLAKEARKRLGV